MGGAAQRERGESQIPHRSEATGLVQLPRWRDRQTDPESHGLRELALEGAAGEGVRKAGGLKEKCAPKAVPLPLVSFGCRSPTILSW